MADPIRQALERLLAVIKPKYTDPDEIVAVVRAMAAARAALAAEPPAPDPREALAARPLLEAVSHLGDCIGQHTVVEITTISERAAAWLRENPPGQPVTIEPRGCPTPGACSCVEPPAPGPTIDDIWELCEDHEFHLGMDGANEEESAEGLLQIIRTALARWGHPAPAPAADGEREELAQWLEGEARSCAAQFHDRIIRAAALLRQPAPAPVPVPVAERPWEREGWCDAEGRCWFGAPVAGAADAGWILRKPSERLSYHVAVLPHWAIAIPQPPQVADTGLVYSTGPAVDLVKLDEAMRKFSREPWDLPPPTNTTHPIPTEPPTDD